MVVPVADLRCEAFVRGWRRAPFEWMRLDHRCPRKANQARMGRSVCWQHGAIHVKKLKFYTGKPDGFYTGEEDMQSKDTRPAPANPPSGGTSGQAKGADAGRKVLMEVIDLTPSWRGLLPALLGMLTDGVDASTRELARTELEKMARAADAFNIMVRTQKAAARATLGALEQDEPYDRDGYGSGSDGS
jgi:hypothetical protein